MADMKSGRKTRRLNIASSTDCNFTAVGRKKKISANTAISIQLEMNLQTIREMIPV